MSPASTKNLKIWTCPACGEIVPEAEPHKCAAALDITAHGQSAEEIAAIAPESIIGTILGERYAIQALISQGGSLFGSAQASPIEASIDTSTAPATKPTGN